MEYLRQISKEVDFNDSDLLNNIEMLKKFCKNNEVLALAAVQLGITKRIGLTKYWEACASCLDNVGLVKRPYIIEIDFYDINGQLHSQTFEGFPATVISHEYDHLNGTLHMDIADKIVNLPAEERKILRQKEGYEIISKSDDYEKLKTMKFYNKLVRDNIPEIMIKNGATPITRILNDDDYLNELNKKLLEEVNEYLESGDILELADIEEVLLALLSIKKVSIEEFENTRIDKVKKRGTFTKKIFLESEK